MVADYVEITSDWSLGCEALILEVSGIHFLCLGSLYSWSHERGLKFCETTIVSELYDLGLFKFFAQIFYTCLHIVNRFVFIRNDK